MIQEGAHPAHGTVRFPSGAFPRLSSPGGAPRRPGDPGGLGRALALGPRIGALRACPGMTLEGAFMPVMIQGGAHPSHGAVRFPSGAFPRLSSPGGAPRRPGDPGGSARALALGPRSEEHTSELQSLMRISYAVFCLKKKITQRYKST